MDHDGARRLMAEAMEGKVGPDQERDLALHLVGCTECKVIYEGLQQAHPALTSMDLGSPSTKALDAAVFRATTVLRGDADPGPMGLTEEAPRLVDDEEHPTIRIDTSGAGDDRLTAPPVPAVPMPPVPEPETPSPTVMPVPRQSTEPFPALEDDEADHGEPLLDDTDLAPWGSDPHGPTLEPEPTPSPDPEEPVIPATPASPSGPEPEPSGPILPPLEPTEPVRDPTGDLPPVFEPAERPAARFGPEEPAPSGMPTDVADSTSAPRSEIDTLLDQDRERFEPLPYPDELDEERRGGPGPWLFAIAITVALAVLAGMLIFRGGGLFDGGGDLPDAAQVQSRLDRAFTDMKTLKTSFSVQKLSLYRAGGEENSLVYTFSNGHYSGRLVYDRSEGHREEVSLEVADNQVEQAQTVQTSNETRSVVGTGTDQRLVILENPPLGPPDGAFRASLGVLEDSFGGAARLLATANDLEVVGSTERDGRQLYEVRATVPANELTRADRIEAALDATTLLPVVVKRSISRTNASVLGPDAVLTDQAISTAFGENERITTELVELDNLIYDDIVLPGDLVLDVAEGLPEERQNAGFERVTRTELSDRVDYQPLLPRSLPGNFEEQHLALYTGEPQAWGPNAAYPAARSVLQATYFDGRTTIAVTQRRMAERFELDGSPLARTGLPIEVEQTRHDDKVFFYGSSPEVPPHAYAFLGDTFVIAVGYAPKEVLIEMLNSLGETPVDVPTPLATSPEPDGPGVEPTP